MMRGEKAPCAQRQSKTTKRGPEPSAVSSAHTTTLAQKTAPGARALCFNRAQIV